MFAIATDFRPRFSKFSNFIKYDYVTSLFTSWSIYVLLWALGMDSRCHFSKWLKINIRHCKLSHLYSMISRCILLIDIDIFTFTLLHNYPFYFTPLTRTPYVVRSRCLITLVSLEIGATITYKNPLDHYIRLNLVILLVW